MRTLVGISVALVALGTLGGCAGPAQTLSQPVVRDTFEGDTINPAFWLCLRPENTFTITDEQARSGGQSLRLAVHRLPLFAHLTLPAFKEASEAKSCMVRRRRVDST